MISSTPAMSHTRVKQWELCPTAYKLKYIDRAPAQRADCLDLGIVVHRALELLVRQAVAKQEPLTGVAAQEALREAWVDETATGFDKYAEAASMVQRFATGDPTLPTRSILGIEQSFSIDVGAVKLTGVMERVDRLNHDTIEVIDYKTSVLIPTAEELAENLQLTLYHHAAHALWPRAKNIKLTLHMLRHGVKLHTTRTPEQVATALQYTAATAQQIATSAETGECRTQLKINATTSIF